jgi:hypothetical protein
VQKVDFELFLCVSVFAENISVFAENVLVLAENVSARVRVGVKFTF